MSRTADIAHLAELIRVDLAGGAWHKAVGLGGWGHDIGLLLQQEVIEYDARRRVYRLRPVPAAQQLTLTEEA